VLRSSSVQHDLLLVTILVPCRNEAKFIGPCLDSILANDYPIDRLEVFVIEGRSTDGTRKVVEDYVARNPHVFLVDNPKMITPTALNMGISRAKGEVIIWMSAHNRYCSNYISRSVECLQAYNADNVGGVIVTEPRDPTLMGRAIVAALSHIFGVGASYFRIRRSQPTWVDTVFGGCYKKAVFDRIGLFNEALIRGQDMEFNIRLKKAGGKILLVPDIVSFYAARSDFGSFVKHNWTNGVWAVLPFAYSQVMPVSWRHLVPMAFVLGLAGLGTLAIIWSPGGWLLAGALGAYAVATVAAAIHIAVREHDARLVPLMPLIFIALHLSYGSGSLWGAVKTVSAICGFAQGGAQ
jgi:glycosyltransferase involved in cell wall biosynthesis